MPEALASRFQIEHQAVMDAQLLAHIDTLDAAVQNLSERIEFVLAPHQRVIERLSTVLRAAGETHHTVFAIVDGADDDWATWYADWLVHLSELPALLGTTPVRSELTWALVGLDKEYVAASPAERWEDFYARALVERFAG